jgi:hypothetical protein
MIKPEPGASEAVPLRFGKKDKSSVVSDAGSVLPATAAMPNGNHTTQNGKPAGVGFVDFSDDLDDSGKDDDDELIDEDSLLTEEDLKRPVAIRKSRPQSFSNLPLLIPF